MLRDNYSLTIIAIPRFKTWFIHHEKQILDDYRLREDDLEHVYDYCVTHGFADACRDDGGVLIGTYRHDVYDMVYEDLAKHFIVEYIKDKLHFYDIDLARQSVKILVMGDKVILGVKR